MSKTFAIIKPDAVALGYTGKILTIIEEKGFRILALRMTHMSKSQAEGFYAVHKERPFFGGLVQFMIEAPCVLMCLEREDAVPAWRELMGATNPDNAGEGTLRKLFGASIERNATHGSDSEENAANEIAWFFCGYELT